MHVRLLIFLLCTVAAAADSSPEMDFFEKKIRPVLAEKCYSCHSVEAEGRKKLKGALYLDSKAGTLKGGEDGPAVVPGDLDKSLLIKGIRYHKDLEMPPKEKLPDHVIADFEGWVKMGAPDPRVGDQAPKAGAAIAEQTKTHWSFQPVVSVNIPSVKQAGWVKNDLDKFILEKLEVAKIAPAAQADKYALLRRATMDLTGLPASAEEVAAFIADTSPQAFAKVIDRLLASPAYGERWGRHWLDVARYADTKGYVFQEDRSYPYAYTYRDWVVQALNDDLPYDRFLQLQIAADRLVDDNNKKDLAAMAFMTVGRRFINNINDIIDDRIDVLGRGILGMTISCSRCHDHKYDPIPTKDYYALYGVYASSEEPNQLPIIGTASDPQATKAFDEEFAKREKARDDYKNKAYTESITELRTVDVLAKYLLAGWDSLDKDGKVTDEIAGQRTLEKSMVQRWKDYLKKIKLEDPVFGPWRSLAGTSEQDFPSKAAELFATVFATNGDKINPLVLQALKDSKPDKAEIVAKQLAALIVAHDGDQPHDEAHKEQLRLVLRGPNTPTNVPIDRINTVISRKQEEEISKLQRKIDELPNSHPGAPPRAMVLNDRAKPHNVKVFVRGQQGNDGEEAPRGFLSFIAGKEAKPFSDGSGRLELARAITDHKNPLTARVIVNRVWTWHFGGGIVRTPSDFGLRTAAPVHQALLDWMTTRFLAEGWSLKKLHRLIMLSATYQQTSMASTTAMRLDPENILWTRFPRQRLDLEALRDSALAVSGRLDRSIGGRPVEFEKQATTNRRTLYLEIDRQNLPGMFRAFDFASPDAHTPVRYHTTVPQQALFLMNNQFMVEQARALTKKTEKITNPEQRAQQLYKDIYARAASEAEIKRAAEFVRVAGTLPAQDNETPIWSYGYGTFNPKDKGLSSFTALPHFEKSVWQGGEKLPDPKLTWASLTKNGGHPGNTHELAVVRRFSAPAAGNYRVEGELRHKSKNGDGVLGLVVVDGKAVADWLVKHGDTKTTADGIRLQTGQTIDFVVDNNGDSNSDSFEWSPTVVAVDAGRVWSAESGFSGPITHLEPLGVWDRLAQAMLLSNEFAFTD